MNATLKRDDEPIEGNLRRLARGGLALFFLMAATLGAVQLLLGQQIHQLEQESVESERLIGNASKAMAGLYERQARVSRAASVEGLDTLGPHAPLAAAFTASIAGLDASMPSADTQALQETSGLFLETDQALFDAAKDRLKLETSFGQRLEEVGSGLRTLIEEARGVAGIARLNFVLLLVQLERNPKNTPLVRDVVMGESRVQQEAVAGAVQQILTLGMLGGKIGLAPNNDAVNSIAANEIAQTVAETRLQLLELGRLTVGRDVLAKRVASVSAKYEQAVSQITDETRPESLISLRRRWFEQNQQAEKLQRQSGQVADVVAAKFDAIEARVQQRTTSASARAQWVIWAGRGVTLLLLAFGVAMLVAGRKRIGNSVEALQDKNQQLERLGAELFEMNKNLEGLVETRTLELANRERAMRLVLESTGDGLITLDLEGKISGDTSRAVREWLGEPRPGMPIAEFLFGDSAASAAAFAGAFEQLAADFLPFEVSAEQMPARLRRGDQWLGLSYRQVLRDGVFAAVLMVIQDITSRVEAERFERDQREFQAIVRNLLRDPAGFRAFHQESVDLIERLTSAESPNALRRDLHTLKGNSAVFGLQSVAALCHQLEEKIDEQAGRLTGAQLAELAESWTNLTQRLEEFSFENQDEMHVHRGDLEGLVAMLHANQSNERILSLVQTWPEPRIEREFERLKDQALRLGERLGKPMQVEMVHNDLRMPKRFRSFWSSLVHAVRNALLHGIELPAQRQAAGKPSAGRLQLSAKQEGADTVIVIRDDGRGIDWEALSQTATRLGLPSQTHAQLVDALFAVGVSTASEVTDLAGRGVGMAAIKSEVDALNGSISVESPAKGGTTLHIRFRRSSAARSMVPPEVAA
jgi:two-component system chemotaxis sensor kinase CheA